MSPRRNHSRTLPPSLPPTRSNNKSRSSPLSPHGLLLIFLSALACGGTFFATSIFLRESSATTAATIDSNLMQHLQQAIDSGSSSNNNNKPQWDEADKDCIFRDSPIYRKVFVYPNPGEQPGWEGDILSSQYASNITTWPWIELDQTAREKAQSHYNVWGQNVQYATELLVRELMINKDSCLRTYNPEEATLFYVPYLPSTEHHMGHDRKTNYDTSAYGQAIMDILDKNEYENWERTFGLTSRYWKRRKGSDHILVFSEPMHGLYHPRNKRGNFHFVHSQKQLTPPIVISVELSTTFVEMYPHCAAKNILVPYPNTHGAWFNGQLQQSALELTTKYNLTSQTSLAALPNDRPLNNNSKPLAQYYAAGNHGTCTQLRRSMKQDYTQCSLSNKVLPKELSHNSLGMRISTFCPCPGGDSPSAKRMFDALLADCIPVILSHDFVWPFTKEFDPTIALDPSEFSVRLQTPDYNTPLLNDSTCQPIDPKRPGMQYDLEQFTTSQLEALHQGAAKARDLYAWYAFDAKVPTNPLKDGILPNGGTAKMVVQMLAERAAGTKWPQCQQELDQLPMERNDARKFIC